jgi:hypothetical protein
MRRQIINILIFGRPLCTQVTFILRHYFWLEWESWLAVCILTLFCLIRENLVSLGFAGYSKALTRNIRSRQLVLHTRRPFLVVEMCISYHPVKVWITDIKFLHFILPVFLQNIPEMYSNEAFFTGTDYALQLDTEKNYAYGDLNSRFWFRAVFTYSTPIITDVKHSSLSVRMGARMIAVKYSL